MYLPLISSSINTLIKKLPFDQELVIFLEFTFLTDFKGPLCNCDYKKATLGETVEMKWLRIRALISDLPGPRPGSLVCNNHDPVLCTLSAPLRITIALNEVRQV